MFAIYVVKLATNICHTNINCFQANMSVKVFYMSVSQLMLICQCL